MSKERRRKVEDREHPTLSIVRQFTPRLRGGRLCWE